jgi:hypothetical protein
VASEHVGLPFKNSRLTPTIPSEGKRGAIACFVS